MKPQKNYRCIIFDADHTIIDFDRDERRAFAAAFAAAGAACDDTVIEEMWRFSFFNWQTLGLNDVHLPAIQADYHKLYYDHVAAIFDYAQNQFGLKDRKAGEEAFMQTLCEASYLIDGAQETLAALSKKYLLCVATNGLTAMQTGRLSQISNYFARIFISEELNTIKPCAAFYQKILSELCLSAEECLAVGDSLSSDIAGANAAGIDAVFYNPQNREIPNNVKIAAQISRLTDLLQIL